MLQGKPCRFSYRRGVIEPGPLGHMPDVVQFGSAHRVHPFGAIDADRIGIGIVCHDERRRLIHIDIGHNADCIRIDDIAIVWGGYCHILCLVFFPGPCIRILKGDPRKAFVPASHVELVFLDTPTG